MRVKVCDSIMGSGKTEASIYMMDNSPDRRFLFITPRKSEIKRIRKSCKNKRFFEPEPVKGKKLLDLHDLVSSGKDIASTHKLFSMFTDETKSALKNGGYTLILDEAVNVVSPIRLGPRNTEMLFLGGVLSKNDDGRVVWADDSYKESWGQSLKPLIKSNYTWLEKDQLLYWVYPPDIFNLFEEIYMLTYRFDGSSLHKYFSLFDSEIEYLGVQRVDDHFEFCGKDGADKSPLNLKSLIHILDAGKVNDIGKDKYALSYTKQIRDNETVNKPLLSQIQKNVRVVFSYHFKKYGCNSGNVMWSCYKPVQDELTAKGFSGGFVPFNCNAVNDYGDRQFLAYCVNIFCTPEERTYFSQRGTPIDEDTYALSIMIQWIWRSAIRNGKEIWLYLPSSRMRKLLTDWLEEVG